MSKKDEPVYQYIHNNSKWSERDSLPTQDPIGDVDENITPIKNGVYDPYVEGYKAWKADLKSYEEKMKPNLIVPEGKDVEDALRYMTATLYPAATMPIEVLGKFEAEELKCTCGTHAVHGKNVPLKAHAYHCDLVRNKVEC